MSELDNPRDLAFAPNGALYVAEAGRLSRVNSDRTVTPLLEGLNRPTAVAVGADGAIYVTNNGVTAGAGEVLMIAP